MVFRWAYFNPDDQRREDIAIKLINGMSEGRAYRGGFNMKALRELLAERCLKAYDEALEILDDDLDEDTEDHVRYLMSAALSDYQDLKNNSLDQTDLYYATAVLRDALKEVKDYE